MMADGNPVKVPTINSVGLKRAEVSEASQRALKLAHRFLYRQDLTDRARPLEAIERELEQTPEIRHLVEFIRASERGIVK
jgi:UDP-N-acetylglucosamine acyltransferase